MDVSLPRTEAGRATRIIKENTHPRDWQCRFIHGAFVGRHPKSASNHIHSPLAVELAEVARSRRMRGGDYGWDACCATWL